jgi:hypothetical protein
MSKSRNKLLPLLLPALLAVPAAHAGVDLIAIGGIDGSYEDLSTETATPLENGVPGNRFGGIGSGLAYAGAQRLSLCRTAVPTPTHTTTPWTTPCPLSPASRP